MFLIISGVVLAVAGLLPYIKVATGIVVSSRDGFDLLPADVITVLLLAVVTVAGSVAGLFGVKVTKRAAPLFGALITGIVACGLTGYDVAQVHTRVTAFNALGQAATSTDANGTGVASIGAGAYLAVVGAALVLLSAVFAVAGHYAERTAQPGRAPSSAWA